MTKNDVKLTLLLIGLQPIGAGLPSLPPFVLSRQIRGLLPQMNRVPININNDDAQYEALKVQQSKYIKDNDTHKDLFSFPIGSTVAIKHEDSGLLMPEVIKEANNSDYNMGSYIVRLMKQAD